MADLSSCKSLSSTYEPSKMTATNQYVTEKARPGLRVLMHVILSRSLNSAIEASVTSATFWKFSPGLRPNDKREPKRNSSFPSSLRRQSN